MHRNTLLPIMLSIMVSFSFLGAAAVTSSLVVDDGAYKTCLYIADENDQIFAERNLADFIYSNKQQLQKLDELVYPAKNTNPIDKGAVKKILLEILNSETNIAVQFCKRPEEFIQDLNRYTSIVWQEGYRSKGEDITSEDEIKNMLITLHQIVKLTVSPQ